MTLEFNAFGRIRKLLEGVDASSVGDEEQIAMTPQLELLVAQGSTPFREIVRVGRAFWTGTTATAIAAVVAIPTTAHMFSLYNNYPDGGRSLVIDWVAASGVVKTAVAGQAQLIVNLGQVREAIPTASALTIKKANGYGGGTADTLAISVVAGSLPASTGVAGNWCPLGPAIGFPGTGATPGLGLWSAVDGRFIVPPGRYFAMHVLADVIGSTFQSFIGWHEAQLNLG